MKNAIPPITDPLGRHWRQPAVADITVDDKCALMTQGSFDMLYEYSNTLPSGTYAGKMWKKDAGGCWKLCWFHDLPDMPDQIGIQYREIIVI